MHFVSVLHTSSNRLLLSNQDKGCTLCVAHPHVFPLGPTLHNISIECKLYGENPTDIGGKGLPVQESSFASSFNYKQDKYHHCKTRLSQACLIDNFKWLLPLSCRAFITAWLPLHLAHVLTNASSEDILQQASLPACLIVCLLDCKLAWSRTSNSYTYPLM